MQELLEWVRATLPMDLDTPIMIEQKIESMLEKEQEFTTNFAMDYVFSGNVGCAIWADGPPELDIEKNARDYYKEYINTTSLDSTEWSNTKEK